MLRSIGTYSEVYSADSERQGTQDNFALGNRHYVYFHVRHTVLVYLMHTHIYKSSQTFPFLRLSYEKMEAQSSCFEIFGFVYGNCASYSIANNFLDGIF